MFELKLARFLNLLEEVLLLPCSSKNCESLGSNRESLRQKSLNAIPKITTSKDSKHSNVIEGFTVLSI